MIWDKKKNNVNAIQQMLLDGRTIKSLSNIELVELWNNTNIENYFYNMIFQEVTLTGYLIVHHMKIHAHSVKKSF